MKRGIIILAAACLIVAAWLAQRAWSRRGSIFYANAEQYRVGDVSLDETIERIDIQWVSGRVKLVTQAGRSVSLSEKSDRVLSDDMRVHWWLDGTTLRIRFCAPGIRLRLFGYGEKELTVAVPEGLRLSEVTVNAASADLQADAIRADRLSATTASGGMRMDCEAEELALDSASGDIALRQTGRAAHARIHTASGEIDARLAQCDTAELQSASGAIRIATDEVSDLSAGAASGSVYCRLNEAAERCALQTASGRVTLDLAEGIGFTARISTGSGDFHSDLALKKDGNRYVCGDGAAEISVKTASGDVTIQQAD